MSTWSGDLARWRIELKSKLKSLSSPPSLPDTWWTPTDMRLLLVMQFYIFRKTRCNTCSVKVWQRCQKWARLFTSNRVSERERERKVFHFRLPHTSTNIIVRTFLLTPVPSSSLNLSSRSEAALDEGGMVDGRKKSINGMMRKGHKTFVAPFFAFPLFKDFCTQVKFFVTLEARTHTFGCRCRFFPSDGFTFSSLKMKTRVGIW